MHLKRTSTKDFNEGSAPSLSDLRGSGALEQLSHNVYSLERNQQSEKGNEKFCSVLRVLKTRYGFETGKADTLEYNRVLGRNQLCTNFPVETGDFGSSASYASEPQKF